MLRIAIVCVNYNSYDKVSAFFDSLEVAMKNCDAFQLDVFMADNSSRKQNFENRWNFNLVVRPFPNIGYFGAAFKIINTLAILEYDYTIVSNVDVCVSDDFFDVLIHLKQEKNVAWIAPQIYSIREHRDKNPQRMHRPSPRRIRQLIFMHTHPFFMNLYERTFYKRKCNSRLFESGTKIYCGHGSFIILTKEFFKKYTAIEYPCFLYCEELFLGELIQNAGLKVVYEPTLKVLDDEHVSTGQLPGKVYFKYNIESLQYIYKTFYMDKM